MTPDGVPVLLNRQGSVFDSSRGEAYESKSRRDRLAKRLLPKLTGNYPAEGNYRRLAAMLMEGTEHATVLVVGGQVLGEGMSPLVAAEGITLIESDIAIGPRTQAVFDAAAVPFEDETFDAVVAQAVLEHVIDPWAVVDEIWRVLKPGGLVYAETPFMAQVHEGAFDFTRFTHLGHRNLFRWFDEVDSGVACGPGTALAWSYQYFLLSFVRRPQARLAVKAFARLTGFWLKWFDRTLNGRPGAIDAASAVYFLGRRSEVPLAVPSLIAGYRGAGD